MSFDEIRSSRKVWEGETKLVIGIDIGPTQSGVAFAFLEKGANQDVHRVTRWPGQESHNQHGRIPTLIWYDTNRKAVAFGAEAVSCAIEEEAEDNGWTLAKHFKLHLHPSDIQVKHALQLDPLPPGVSLRQIYCDFLEYLLKHTKRFFEDRIVDGRRIWERFSSTMEVVIAHPNGWGIREQIFLRLAAVDAGLSTADAALNKIQFVTEAEASVHFCLEHTNLQGALQPGTNFAVCDAGGSTVDTTLYSVISTSPILRLEEKRSPACVQAGAIFVDSQAEAFLYKTLTGAGLSQEDVGEYVKAGVKDFEIYTKRVFKDVTNEYSICIAGSRLNNPAIRTRRGRMVLSGSTIKGFFNACVKEITGSVDQQLDGFIVPHILLVGGFGDSPYLRWELQKRYESRGSQVTSTNDSCSKAVADGAVLWAAANSLLSRAPRLSWGIETLVPFNPNDSDHLQRVKTSSGSFWPTISGKWKCLVRKGVPLDDAHSESVMRIPYSLEFPLSSTELGEFKLDLYSYSGDDEPVWMRNKQGTLLPRFCQAVGIQTSLESLRGALETCICSGGILQRRMDFEVCMNFGGVELEVYLEWEEKGVKRIGPTSSLGTTIRETQK